MSATTYTCPMHPSIRWPAPGRCPTCGMDLVRAGAGKRTTALTIGTCVLLAVAAFFLWTEHRAHVLGALPYVLLLLCPLMHLLMHRKHRGHHGGHELPTGGGA